MEREIITLAEFHARLKAQNVPREHLAFKCPICGTVQSMTSLIAAGVDAEQTERCIGFSCVGRWMFAGPHEKGTPPGKGCNWTLGGLFQLHKLEVIAEDGSKHMHFEIATPEEAKRLMEKQAAVVS